ncbi:type II secretion system secretin GspD [Acidisphaera sp. S103]|uniref:type II secretion system secretin GspD n=1 Tax=Acidisphaera sp. S103 TaxID=1747223 RepID=UPI00131D84D1|nr:type II secretion system secretin GspD [Acidisphaera sp. S103]
MNRCFPATLAALTALAGCAPAVNPALEPLPPVSSSAGAASPRIDGSVGVPDAMLPAQVSYGTKPGTAVSVPNGGGTGNVVLNFADTDIREVVAQILGTMLKVNYAIDPTVHGTATFRTVRPLDQTELLAALQTMLAQSGAALLQSGSLYRVVPAGAAAAPALAGSSAAAGSVVVRLRYASAEDLAKLLQPYAGNNAKIIAGGGSNTLIVGGEPGAREALVSLVQAFDVDALAGQSYALLPVPAGSAKDFASALMDAFGSQRGEPLAGVVRAMPMERMNSVLLVSSQQRYIDDSRRIYAMVARTWQETVRNWHVYYLQNSHSDDVAYLLQQAYTPNNVTARPSSHKAAAMNSLMSGQTGGGGGASSSLSGLSGGIGGGAAPGTGSGVGGAQGVGTQNNAPAAGSGGTQQAAADASPLLGGLNGGNNADVSDGIRIIPDEQNNAVMIYATPREQEAVVTMLHKVDILPLEVRIDATIAEVTLNDALQYGTQWFFRSGGVNGVLSGASQSLGPAGLVASQLNTNFPGFVVGGTGSGGAPFVLSALQAVTTVHVLSSPEIMVLDNQQASLMVGSLVPYLTGTTTSTLTADSAVTNSINYQPTGVIMQVTPRVNSGGLVTLDVQQQVSSVATSTTAVSGTSGINSPTFNERQVVSRVVVQDGQTVGLAGLITDNVSRSNQGIPWLKDIPVLGFLAGQQSNQRTRTELLVLITPHVIHDQQDARALTQDLRDQMSNAASVPQEMQHLPASGSADPGQALRRKLHLE